MAEYENIRETLLSFKGNSISDYEKLLLILGNYFSGNVPTQIDEEFAQKTEFYLNELYTITGRSNTSQDFRQLILSAINISSFINRSIKSRKFDREFFSRVKQLGASLSFIGYYINDNKNSLLVGDSTTDAPPPKGKKQRKGK